MTQLQGQHHSLHHLLQLKVNKEILEVGASQLFSRIGRDLIALSLIYVMFRELNYAIWQIIFFYVLWCCSFWGIPWAGKLVEKIGLKHAMAINGLGEIIVFAALPFVLTENYWLSMFVAFFVMSIRGYLSGCFKVSYEVFLSHHLSKKSQGKELAWLQISIIFAGVASPLIGTMITAFFGFLATVALSIFFFTLSALVLFLTPDEKVSLQVKPKAIIKDTFLKTPKPIIQAELGHNIFGAVIWIIWPLFLVVSFSSLISTGALVAASSGIAMIVAYLTGRKVDRAPTAALSSIKRAVGFSTILNFLRAVWLSPYGITIIDALDNINRQKL